MDPEEPKDPVDPEEPKDPVDPEEPKDPEDPEDSKVPVQAETPTESTNDAPIPVSYTHLTLPTKA